MQHQQSSSIHTLDLFAGFDLPVNSNRPSLILVSEDSPVAKDPTLNSLIPAYVEMRKKIAALYDEQKKLEKQLFGSVLSDAPQFPRLIKLGETAIHSLVSKASVLFSTPGANLKIDSGEILNRIGQSDWEKNFHDAYRKKGEDPDCLDLDLNQLWSEMETLYGGDAGVKLVFQQQCKILMNEFNLKDDSNIVKKSSHIAISRRVFCEKEDYGSHKGLYKVGYGYISNLREIFIALSAFTDWADLTGLKHDLKQASISLCDHYSHFSPRDKTSLEGLNIVRYKEKIEFQFSFELAEQLMLFLGEFNTN
jgi:hypothetical protein